MRETTLGQFDFESVLALRFGTAQGRLGCSSEVCFVCGLTDEHGFAAAQSCGGFGILVGRRRETKAKYRLADVDGVIAWLEALIAEPAA